MDWRGRARERKVKLHDWRGGTREREVRLQLFRRDAQPLPWIGVVERANAR